MFWPQDTGKLLKDDDGKTMREPNIDPAVEGHAILKGVAPSNVPDIATAPPLAPGT